MAPQSHSISEAAKQLEKTASRLRSLSDVPETQSIEGNKAVEATLKEISNQLRRNKRHLRKLRRAVQSNENKIEKCIKRMDAMAYNSLARMLNKRAKDIDYELMPIRDRENKNIKGFPITSDFFPLLIEDECDRMARDMDFPFYTYTETDDKPRNILETSGYGGDVWELF